MYDCEVFEYGETIDCKNKAECLEVMVSCDNFLFRYMLLGKVLNLEIERNILKLW